MKIILVLVLVLLAGCTPRALTGVCGVRMIGQDEAGTLYVRWRCEQEAVK